MSDNGARPQGETTLAKALNAGLVDALAADDHVVIMGEDVGTLGGVFRITDGLKTQFGGRRTVVPAGDDPHPVRRWCRLSGTPFGVPGGVLREHPGPQGGQLLEP